MANPGGPGGPRPFGATHKAGLSSAKCLGTVSAQGMPGALIAGERDPEVLAELARKRRRAKIPVLKSETRAFGPSGALPRIPARPTFSQWLAIIFG